MADTTDELRAVACIRLVLIPNHRPPNMSEQYHIICPHCDKEMEDSADWGYPDTEWEEDAQCPYCEKEFRWKRTLHHYTYTVEKKEPGDMEPDYFGKILPEGERLCIQCGKIHRTDEACPRNENAKAMAPATLEPESKEDVEAG